MVIIYVLLIIIGLSPTEIRGWFTMVEKRIVNGVTAEEGSFPAYVMVGSDAPLTSDINYCGGILLNQYTVLSSITCVKKFGTKKTRIKPGLYRVGKDSMNWYKVGWVCSSVKYNATSLAYDVAILRLERPLLLTHRVKSMSLADRKLEMNEQVWLAGMGALYHSGEGKKIDERLQVLAGRVEKCPAGLKNVFCFRTPETRSGSGCYGDEGGMVAAAGPTGVLRAHGIKSGRISTEGECKPGSLQAAVDIYSVMDEINYLRENCPEPNLG